MNHEQLCQLGVKFLKKMGCSVILKEFVSLSTETPDVLGFNGCTSILVEAKCSRADFFADAKKHSRRVPNSGIGQYRFYICPEGMIKENEVPPGWGLIYGKSEKEYQIVLSPKGNYVHSWPNFFECNVSSEKAILLSSLRRIKKDEIKNRNFQVFIQEDNWSGKA